MAGLRVSRADRGGPPGLLRGTIRTLVFYGLLELPADLVEHFAEPAAGPGMIVKFWAYGRLIQCLGALALIATMRRKSGFRGPHEWLSGTRVVQSIRRRTPRPPRRLHSLMDSRLVLESTTQAPEPLQQLGSYVIRGVVTQNEDGKVLLGQDSSLDRPVWIVFGTSTHRLPPCPGANGIAGPGRDGSAEERTLGADGTRSRLLRDCPWMRW